MEAKQNGLMKWLAVIVGVLTIGLGCYFLFYPRGIIGIFFAAVAVHGLVQISRFIFNKEARNAWDVVAGIINLLFGAILLFGDMRTRAEGLLALELFIAIWIILVGLLRAFGSFGLKSHGFKNWVWMLVGGICLILCGVVFLVWPIMTTVVIVEIAAIFGGIALIFTGLSGIADAFSQDSKKTA